MTRCLPCIHIFFVPLNLLSRRRVVFFWSGDVQGEEQQTGQPKLSHAASPAQAGITTEHLPPLLLVL